MRYIILLITVLLNNVYVYGQVYPLQKFVLHPVPKPLSAQWYKLVKGNSTPFKVAIVKGKLHVSAYTGSSNKTYKVPGGKLLAVDKGEWGGGLFYAPDHAAQTEITVNNKRQKTLTGNVFTKVDKIKRALIANSNTQAVEPYQNYWLYIQGLAHMGTNYGSISKLTIKADTFSTSKLFDLDSQPTAITTHQKLVYISTYKGFWVIKNSKIEQVLDNAFWQGLNANSIAVLNEENIYVGMEGGYASINLPLKEIRFFIYKK